jgi:hypothetical protein
MHNKFFRKLNDEYGAGNNTLKKYKDKCELEQWSSGLSAVLPDFVVIVTRNITNYVKIFPNKRLNKPAQRKKKTSCCLLF